jgi:phage tail-like protein
MTSATKLGEYPKFGVTWFFRVTIDGGGARDLGRWSSCGGLGLTLDTEAVSETGVYDEPSYLPTEVRYNRITLERAMHRKSSQVVRDWVQDVVDKWVNGDGTPYAGSDVTITLFDNIDKPVMSWTLRNAIPVQWAGPQLNANGTSVAIEKLELVHQGFAPSPGSRRSTPPSTTANGSLAKASLSYQDEPKLTFRYNPTHLRISQQAAIEKLGDNVQMTPEELIKSQGVKTFEIGSVPFTGTGVEQVADRLLGWLEPMLTSTSGKGKNQQLVAEPKVLTFSMGTINLQVVLTKVDVDYTRFTPEGVPIRASVGISFKEPPKRLPPTNPSSGGPGGGLVHTVTEGDRLPGVAASAYGTPSAWREIAEANGIDDPLRVRPGALLYLPGT